MRWWLTTLIVLGALLWGCSDGSAGPEDGDASTSGDASAGDGSGPDGARDGSPEGIDGDTGSDARDADLGQDGSDAELAHDAPDAELLPCPAEGPHPVALIAPAELAADLEEGDVLLINVASPTGAQIPGTDTYIAHTDIEGLVSFIGPALDTPVTLYCVSGARSTAASDALAARGYCSIRNLQGGLRAWEEAGYPLE